MLFETSGEGQPIRLQELDMLEAIRFLTLTEIDGTAGSSILRLALRSRLATSLLEFCLASPIAGEMRGFPIRQQLLDPRGFGKETTGSYCLTQTLCRANQERPGQYWQNGLKRAGFVKGSQREGNSGN